MLAFHFISSGRCMVKQPTSYHSTLFIFLAYVLRVFKDCTVKGVHTSSVSGRKCLSFVNIADMVKHVIE